MKLAILSVTYNGCLLAERLAVALGGNADVYAKAGRHLAHSKHVFTSLSETVEKLFPVYDGLVFIMATGIVVRVIAPHIRDKRVDPAVVVVDERGQYAISLLSGHIGGANDLSHAVAEAIGAQPVITTATDVGNLPAADVLAVKLGLTIEPFENLKQINAAIVHGERVAFFVDSDLACYSTYCRQAEGLGVNLAAMSEAERTETYDYAVMITDKEFQLIKPHLYLRPRTLAVGIGCRRGVAASAILAVISKACLSVGRSPSSIALIGSTVVKSDEQGILTAAAELDVPTVFFTNEQLQQCIEKHQLECSPFVGQQIGVGNVCEPAALVGAQANSLLLPKTIFPQITIAIAEATSRLSVSGQAVRKI